MSVNYTDFDKIWASTSPLTPYEFSESQYKEGWNFVGNTPPSRQMWDKFMQQADEKMQYLYNHESVPVGHEYFTFNPNIPQGSLPLFGGEYSRETYSALWNWVQQQTGYLKTEAEWQQIYTTNAGNVPFYSDGDGSTTFRVPSLKCWVKGANGTVTEVGSYLAAGLPNITGRAIISTNASNGSSAPCDITNVAGAVSQTPSASTTVGFSFVANTKTIHGGFEIDASKSSAVYGNSTTVQPPSIVGMWLVKAYGVVEETGSIDEQQYIDDRLATKLSVTGGTMLGAIKGDSLTLTAENGGNSASLILNSSGSATWNGKEIERVNASSLGTTGYIRYESGLQIVYRDGISITATAMEITYPVAFASAPAIVLNVNGNVNAYATSATSTKFNFNVSQTASSLGGRYIAVGKWK